MPNYFKKKPLFLLMVFILTAIFFSGSAQASLWDMIRAWVTINPLAVAVSAPAEVQVDKNFKVEATISNKGGEAIENARAEIILPSGLVLVGKNSVHEIKVIPAKKERKVSWQVKGEEISSYIISVSASGELRGQLISAEDSVMVEIKESLRRVGPPKWLQTLFDFFRGRMTD